MPSYDKITTIDEMRDYVYTMLGWPVNNLEITEDQVDQCIKDSIQDFHRYNYDEGTYMDVIVFQCSAGVSEYPMSAGVIRDFRTSAVVDNLQDVYDFSVSDGLDGINTLFSPQHILLYDQYVTQGGYPGGPVDNAGIGMTLANFYVSMQYIESIKEAFGKWYTANWLPGREVLKIVPTPTDCVFGALIIYRKEYAVYLYNNPLVKKLTLARAKKIWGRNIGKYNGTLPDGLSINYDMIYNEGKEEEEKIMDWIRQESQPADFFIA